MSYNSIGVDSYYYSKLRQKHEADYLYDSIYQRMEEELESIGYSDEEIGELDKFIEDLTFQFIKIRKEFDAPSPSELIKAAHEDGDIKEYLEEG